MIISGPLARFLQVKHMVPDSFLQSALPSEGTAYRNAFRIAWPSAIESAFIALISAADTMMVGSLGPAAISAVGISSQPRMIMLSLIISLNMGVTAVISRRKGAGDQAGANQCLKQGLLYSICISLIACSLVYVFAMPILRVVGAGPDFIPMAAVYLRIICLGTFFYGLSLTINAAQRGIGNTQLALRTNLTANIVNVVFNYLLIGGHFGFPRLGIQGAAIATALGNIIAFLMSVASVISRRNYIHLGFPGRWRPSQSIFNSLYKVSSSGLAEQLCIRFGMLVYTRVVSSLGVVGYASHVIMMSLYSVTYNLCDGFGVGAAALVGQSLGARRRDLAMMYGRVTQRLAFAISAAAAGLLYSVRFPLVRLFSEDIQVIALASKLILILVVVTLVQTVQIIYANALRGAGDTAYVAKQALVGLGIMRPLSSYLLAYPLGLGVIGAWLGILADQLIRSLLLAKRFSGGQWTKIDL